MAKKQKETFDTTIGEAQEVRAVALAKLIDSNVSPIVSGLAEHKREYQGGPFVVMHNVTSFLTEKEYDLTSLPEPKSETGNNPAHYKLRVVKTTSKGRTESFRDAYFYDDVAMALPSIAAFIARRDILTRSLASDKSKVNTSDIPPEEFNRPAHSRTAEIDRINQQITVAKSNVSAAFELYFQLQAFNELDKVEVEIAFALNDAGELCDGQDGRPFQVEKINSPITVRSTVKGRGDIDKGRYSVGSFTKFDVNKAKEAPGGATFQALENTLAKAPPADAPVIGNTNIMTVETGLTVLNSLAEWLRRIQDTTDKAAYQALHNMTLKTDADGNDAFFNVCFVRDSLNSLAATPRDQVRWQAMQQATGFTKPSAAKVKTAA